ncbi:MAG: hypothetical protein INF52_01070 [Rhodobacter sp.]|nr:hypothetical protein [Rhodobacter sp.]
MAASILRDPPPVSELAARVDFLAAIEFDPGSPLATDPVLIETAELLQVIREPRLWKLPAELVVRHVVPQRIEAAYGAGAAAELARSPALVLVVAHQLQELDDRCASARKRAKSPPPEGRSLVAALVFAEFMAVCGDLPGASFNRQCMEAARRLGGHGAKIDRAVVRRAVEGQVKALSRLPENMHAVAMHALLRLSETFRPGWRKRLA